MIVADANPWFVLLKALGSLALVVGLILVLAWVAKNYFRPERWGRSILGQIKVLHSLPLGPRKRLMIVEVDDKRLLIGVGGDSITSLCELAPVKKEEEA